MGELARWLDEQGLGGLTETFAANDIDIDVLSDLADDDLKHLGISLGNRKRLLKAIASRTRDDGRTSRPIGPAASKKAYAPERRHLSVMFCDLVGSSALAGKLDPEEMRELLRAYQEAVAAEIARFDGHIAQFLGDGVLAYFGWPRAHEDAGERAVRASLAAVQAVGRLPPVAGVALSARAGIATGLVVVGEMAAQEGSATGETPNLAARLQALAERGSVVIDPNTRRLVGNIFEYQDLGSVELKGFAKPIQATIVLREGARETRFEATRAATLTPFVGRETEIAILAERWKQAQEGEGQVVLLCGEPGMGKSRLVETLQRQIATEVHTRLRYQCSPYYTNTALYPFIDQIERVAKLRRDDIASANLDKLEATFAATAITSEALQLLAAMLSIPTADRYPPLELSPQRQKEKLIETIAAQIFAIASLAPVLLILEDAHWSDPTSIEALGAIIASLPSARILALITYRPEFKPTWSGHAHVTTHSVNRLARRQGAVMVEQVTGGKTLPEEVLAQIVAKSDGIPLFVEELTKTVLETGLLVDKGDHYALQGPLTPLAIPATLQDSLMARLDRLAPVKETAQIGAALGREFSYELISLVSPLRDNELTDALGQLVQADLIHVRGNPPDAVYAFKHALVQDAAYETLLKARRQQLHLKIATTFEDGLPRVAEAQPELLARHYTAAGMSTQALPYWTRAGERAMEKCAFFEAIAHFRNGLALVSGLPAEIDIFEKEVVLLNRLGQSLSFVKGWGGPEIREIYERVQFLCETIGDSASTDLFNALFGIATFYMARGEMDRSLRLAEDALCRTEANSEPGLICQAHWNIAFAATWTGRLEKGLFHANRVCELFQPERRLELALKYGHDQRMSACSNAGLSMAALGFPDQARQWRLRALADAPVFNHPNSIAAVKSL